MRHGVATAVLANINRSAEARPEPYKASDFIYWRSTGPQEAPALLLLDDPVAQSNLMRAVLFGRAPV